MQKAPLARLRGRKGELYHKISLKLTRLNLTFLCLQGHHVHGVNLPFFTERQRKVGLVRIEFEVPGKIGQPGIHAAVLRCRDSPLTRGANYLSGIDEIPGDIVREKEEPHTHLNELARSRGLEVVALQAEEAKDDFSFV